KVRTGKARLQQTKPPFHKLLWEIRSAGTHERIGIEVRSARLRSRERKHTKQDGKQTRRSKRDHGCCVFPCEREVEETRRSPAMSLAHPRSEKINSRLLSRSPGPPPIMEIP